MVSRTFSFSRRFSIAKFENRMSAQVLTTRTRNFFLRYRGFHTFKFFAIGCVNLAKYLLQYCLIIPLTLTHAAKGPKGLSCFEKQTAKHFLKLNKFKNLGIPGKLYVDYFPFYNNQLKMPFSICFSAFCLHSQKVRTKTWFLRVMKEYSAHQNISSYPSLPSPQFSTLCLVFAIASRVLQQKNLEYGIGKLMERQI